MEETTNTNANAQAEQPQVAPQKPKNPADMAIDNINRLLKEGFTLPQGYNHVNAIKMAYIQLCGQAVKKYNYVPYNKLCTPASIATALFQMAREGLDATKGQCYFTASGIVPNVTLKFGKEYHAKTLQIQRIFPNYSPCPKVVYEGDELEYDTDPKTGRRFLVRHKQSLANIDNDFVGAYMYIPTRDGGQDLYIMTRKQIMTAWSKSNDSSLGVHKMFAEKMILKTIVNSALDTILRGDDGNSTVIAEDEPQDVVPQEVSVEDIDVDSVETEVVE